MKSEEDRRRELEEYMSDWLGDEGREKNEKLERIFKYGINEKDAYALSRLEAEVLCLREEIEKTGTLPGRTPEEVERIRASCELFAQRERQLYEEVNIIKDDYLRLTPEDSAAVHNYRRRMLFQAREALAEYDYVSALRLDTLLEGDFPSRDGGIRKRLSQALDQLVSPQANPKQRGARALLRNIKEELLDIANTVSEKSPLRREANEAYRLASAKYEEATTSYKKRFFIKASMLAAGIAAASLFTLATIRHYAATHESLLSTLRALVTTGEINEVPREPGGEYFFYIDPAQHTGTLYRAIKRRTYGANLHDTDSSQSMTSKSTSENMISNSGIQ
ncbi:hypothetical protein D6789_02390 [Candidatus Woesearchaeota archaeon]|nr:MAG: hypothetical protein D6789_02390 [Candidatus Woesearchaeota archaeon]